MHATGSLRKYVVDNKVDKDGHPDPRLIVTVEFRFTEENLRSLGQSTRGSQVIVDIQELQPDMFRNGKGSPLDDPKSGTHGATPAPAADPDQLLLLPDGSATETEEAEYEPVDETDSDDDDDEARCDAIDKADQGEADPEDDDDDQPL